MRTRHRVVLAVSAGALVLGAGATAIRSDSTRTPDRSVASSSGSSAALSPAPHRGGALDDGAALPSIGKRQAKEEPQSELEDAWDELPHEARLSTLEREFDEVVEALEAGDGSPVVVARAQGALSELRAQMYSTTEGRAKHQALEERLEGLMGEAKGDDGEGAK